VNKKLRDLTVAVVLTAVYFVAAKLGLRLAYVHPSATAVWAPTGIALAGLLIFGFRAWPGIFLGAFFANLTTAGTVLTSIGIATGNTLEGLAGSYLVKRFARGQRTFQRAQDVFKFTFFAGMASTMISATIGVTVLCADGFARWAMYAPIWRTWWLGDAVGAVVVTPLILLWREDPRLNWTREQMMELALLFSGLVLTAWVVFGERFHSLLRNYPLEYLCVPFLIWAAFRFGRRKSATVTCMLAAVATWGTLHGYGPFSERDPNTSLLLSQLFLGIVSITSLALAAEVSERKRAEERVHRLAVTDPLTGLANYRRLLDCLQAEIKRYDRTQRPFAVLLLDLDNLKKVNDVYGHLVGGRALCRLAEVLRSHCREIDMPARYGGDEFAVVLPETGSLQALQIATRIRERLASDGENPPISVSIGCAVFPEDGETIERILSAADRALYTMKRLPDREIVQRRQRDEDPPQD
jgi:diguanylate cyclase (GGDEF)-like protein